MKERPHGLEPAFPSLEANSTVTALGIADNNDARSTQLHKPEQT
jgi:hypothetical protein